MSQIYCESCSALYYSITAWASVSPPLAEWDVFTLAKTGGEFPLSPIF